MSDLFLNEELETSDEEHLSSDGNEDYSSILQPFQFEPEAVINSKQERGVSKNLQNEENVIAISKYLYVY